MVITKQHNAGPTMKIGATAFCSSFSFPRETLYGLLKNKVNHSAPSMKYTTNASRTLTQLMCVNTLNMMLYFALRFIVEQK